MGTTSLVLFNGMSVSYQEEGELGLRLRMDFVRVRTLGSCPLANELRAPEANV